MEDKAAFSMNVIYTLTSITIIIIIMKHQTLDIEFLEI